MTLAATPTTQSATIGKHPHEPASCPEHLCIDNRFPQWRRNEAEPGIAGLFSSHTLRCQPREREEQEEFSPRCCDADHTVELVACEAELRGLEHVVNPMSDERRSVLVSDIASGREQGRVSQHAGEPRQAGGTHREHFPPEDRIVATCRPRPRAPSQLGISEIENLAVAPLQLARDGSQTRDRQPPEWSRTRTGERSSRRLLAGTIPARASEWLPSRRPPDCSPEATR